MIIVDTRFIWLTDPMTPPASIASSAALQVEAPRDCRDADTCAENRSLYKTLAFETKCAERRLRAPGVLLAIRWALAAPAVVLGEQGPTAALGTSSRMTQPHQLAIFYTFVPVWAIAAVLVFVAAVPLFHAVEIGAESRLESLSTVGRVSVNDLFRGAAAITTSLFAVVEVVLYRRIESTP
jgi:hypothetical protein